MTADMKRQILGQRKANLEAELFQAESLVRQLTAALEAVEGDLVDITD